MSSKAPAKKTKTNSCDATNDSDLAPRRENVLREDAKAVRASRRETILCHVANMLRERRLSTFTLQDVASELGMTKGNIYHYFKDKQELVFHCHMRSMELSLHALETARAEGRSPTDTLQKLLRRHIRAVVNEGFGGLLQTDLESLNPEQRKDYVRERDILERGVRDIIEQGVSAGEMHCENVKLAGFIILGAINWIPKWYDPRGALTADHIAEQVTEQLMNGLVPWGRNHPVDDKTPSFHDHQSETDR